MLTKPDVLSELHKPCRRRAIWAEQGSEPNAINKEIYHGPQNEVVQSTNDNANEADAKANADETNADAQGHEEVNKYACPKCGKEVRRGMYFHKKYCRGLNA